MEIKQSKDVCIDKLCSTEGMDLEIMANLRTPAQIEAVMMGYVSGQLNSKYGVKQYQMLLRCTVSWQGRGRDDLTGIGKVPDVQGWRTGSEDGGQQL